MRFRAKQLKRPSRRRRLFLRRSEAGASAVEFAILAPLLFMVILGMFSGGLAYARKVALTSAAREGVRHGATLPTGPGAVPDSWFDSVADRAIASAAGDLAETWSGQYVCVAYIGYSAVFGSTSDATKKREKSGPAAATYSAGSLTDPNTWCFNDGRGGNGNERRVQVVVKRDTRFDALVFGGDLKLSSDAVARFEALAPPS
jgi:Flp pilus assembly pilin Flp